MSERRRYELRALDGNGNVSAEMVHECDAWTSDSLFCQILDSVIIYAEKVQGGADAAEQWTAIQRLAREAQTLADHQRYEMEIFEIDRRVAKAVATTKKGGSK